jgi:5-methyltetrahydrofolate--homocysteine methyltransferase
MTITEFKKLIREKIVLFDGATGTELQKRGMPSGVCPEKWVIENPDSIIDIQKEYIEAGSNIICSCTFGASSLKLKENGFGDRAYEFNKTLVQLSKKAAGNNALVAGDIGPTGQFISPLGTLSFEEIVNVFKEQIRGLVDGGADLLIIETMMDIQEARAALIAAKESCELPVIASITLSEDGRTLTGTPPGVAAVTLEALGADAIGCNCSTGPEKFIGFLDEISKLVNVPLLAKPNAGLPKLIDGKTVFNMESEEFGAFAEPLIEAGASIIGGCCGTSPEYIKKLRTNINNIRKKKEEIKYTILSSLRKTVIIDSENPLKIIGERINPTGKKKLQKSIKEKDYYELVDLAEEQTEAGAELLDINVGMNGIDEKEIMVNAIEYISTKTEVPLVIDTSDTDVLEAALRIYPGKALINSISLEKNTLDKKLSLAKKYGAALIALPLDDNGVPETLDERKRILDEILRKADDFGIEKKNIIVDGLVMAVSAGQSAAKTTLDTIKYATELGLNSVIGLSNISFGLPQRKWLNQTFLSMATAMGLSLVIANPSTEMIKEVKYSSDVLLERDAGCKEYINRFNDYKDEEKECIEKEMNLYNAILKGNNNELDRLIKNELDSGKKPKEIIDKIIIPAITEVGELYDSKKYYLPQMIQSAEAVKKAFVFLKPAFKKEGVTQESKGEIILATVKGDIHDIGKNIVALMLENYGYNVHDLGKDVDENIIVEKAIELNADIVGLSALMTTTMTEMPKVIEHLRRKKPDIKIIIGGAVVNEEYSKEIKADGYSEDAYNAVKLVEKLT